MTNRLLLEKEIVGSFLWKPKELELVEVKKEWFEDSNNRDIIQVLESKNYQERPIRTNFVEEIRSINPRTIVTADVIEDYQSTGMIAGDGLEEKVHMLERNYRLRLVQKESDRYNMNPTEQNLLELNHATQQYKDFTEEVVDDGRLTSALSEIIDSLDKETNTGIKTYYELDKKFGGGWKGGVMVTIGGATGGGKTSFGINLAMEAVMKNKGVWVDIYSLEMTKLQMAKKLIARTADVNSYALDNPFRALQDDKKSEVVRAAGFLDTMGLRVFTSAYDLSAIEVMIRQNKKKADAEGKEYMAYVDYLQLVGSDNKSDRRDLQVGEVTRRMKLLTLELDIPIILMSQFSRKSSVRDDKTPQLSDLKESSSIEQDSDAVILIHEDKDYQYRSSDGTVNSAIAKATMIIAKNRAGATGRINYHHDKSRTRFVELGAEV